MKALPATSALIAIAVLASVATTLSGCRKNEPAGTTTTTGVEIADPKPANQGKSEDDLGLLQVIRQRLVSDTGLSMRAKTIVVVVQDGVVTLRGSVKDRVEQELVVAQVASVPGVMRLDDRLTFPTAPPKE